jgi:integrase
MMASVVFDDRIYSIVPQSSFEKLQVTFRDQLTQPTQSFPVDLDESSLAWCKLIFSLICAGVAGRRFFEELLDLQYQDILNIDEGYVLIPRWGGRVPLFVEDSVICCALSLSILLTKKRPPDLRGRRFFPSGGYLVPGRTNPLNKLNSSERSNAEERFSKWLNALVKLAKVEEKITISRLAQLVRGYLAKIYSPPIAGAVLGLHRYNPAPISQIAEFDSYLLSTVLQLRGTQADNEDVTEEGLPRIRIPFLKVNNSSQKFKGSPKPELPVAFNMIREIVKEYSRCDKKTARRKRRKVLDRLDAQTTLMESDLEKTWAVDWNTFLDAANSRMSYWKLDGINAVLIAHWMTYLIQHCPPNTVEARLNDLATFMRAVPFRLISLMNEDEIASVIQETNLSIRSKERLASTMRSFFHFMENELGISTPDLGLWYIGWVNSVEEYPLLLPRDFEAILANISEDRKEIVIGGLVAYFWGLRNSEICNLRIGQLLFGRTQTIYVYKGKGGNSRFVEGIEIPRIVIANIEEYCKERLKSNMGNLGAPFLVDKRGRPISRQYLSHHWSEAVKATNLNIVHKRFHTLRHSCGNRWLALGVSLVNIARMLGHQNIATSVQTYIHSFHIIQKEQMEAYCVIQEAVQFTSKSIASLIGVSQRRVCQILVEIQAEYSIIHGKRRYPSKVVMELMRNYILKLEGGFD